MPDGVTLRVDLQDFRRQLREVGDRVERRAVSQGLRDAARVFREQARANAPRLKTRDPRRLPGTLARAIAVARLRRVPRGLVAYTVTVRAATKARLGGARDPFYWRFLEGGWIPRGPGQRLRGGVRARASQREELVRRGARRYQYPFLAPAFSARSAAALVAFERGVERRIAEAQAVR